MDRLAIIQISELGTKLLILESRVGRYNYLFSKEDEFPVGTEIEEEKLLRPKTISKVVSTLTVYREIVQGYNVEKIVGFASEVVLKARNQKGFFEEVYNNTGVAFSILSEEDTVKNLFTAFNSTIDLSKACGVYVGNYSTYIMKYNRRTVLDYFVVPLGVDNLYSEKTTVAEMQQKFSDKLKEISNISVEEGENFVGGGDAFINFGRIAKKISHYPIDMDNNYLISNQVAKDVVEFVKNVDTEKIRKIKGLKGSLQEFLAGLAIIDAIYKFYNVQNLAVSVGKVIDGVIASNVIGEPIEKSTDLLGNTFDNYYEFHRDEFSSNYRVCNMSAILFKQLKVMHKLPRAYVKPMRIAAYMFNCGKSVNFEDMEKHGFYVILNSNIYGASQKDLLLAAFICLCQNPDNFSLAEWMKYKDIVTDEDLDAVRKLGIIVKLAAALNTSKKCTVEDVVCDILGDSIILKTIVNGDASYDIMQGMKVAENYRKIFKKNLQII